MRAVGFGSVRGAPGVTVRSMLVARALAEPTVLVEADLAGGVLAVRYGLGREPGSRRSPWPESSMPAAGATTHRTRAVAAHSLWRRAGDRIARTLVASDATHVVDLGRIEEDVRLAHELSLLVVLSTELIRYMQSASTDAAKAKLFAACPDESVAGPSGAPGGRSGRSSSRVAWPWQSS